MLVWPGPADIKQLKNEFDLQDMLTPIGKSIYGEDPELYMEPFFEREQLAELGFCTENHVSYSQTPVMLHISSTSPG